MERCEIGSAANSSEIDCNSCQKELEIGRLRASLSLAGVAIKSLENENESLRSLITHDELTEIYNRRGWNEAINKEPLDRFYEHKGFNQYSYVVFNIDVNHFKAINDYTGHVNGDKVLKYVANYIEQSFRKSDIVARVGGDEFGVLIKVNRYSEDGGENNVTEIAKSFKDKLNGINFDDEDMQSLVDSFGLGLAVGYTVIDENSKFLSYEDAMIEADKQMYIDKADNKR
jgi:diguanylate cyclase (GGDEF)-like protein